MWASNSIYEEKRKEKVEKENTAMQITIENARKIISETISEDYQLEV